jgi:2-polyprenyl-3-methyl-5-hydroxy-6-metoxy-1,4-benzoquinol methylase
VAAENNDNHKTEELTALVQEIRDRVRARYPGPDAFKHLRITLPDLLPLVHARDAAEAKVASIGTVNPRRGGPLNALAQSVKKMVARALDWHVREQVEFNRHVMASVEATLEALRETNRALSALAGSLQEVPELKDMRSHWVQWRSEWEHKLFVNETQFLRSVADLQGAFQHRASLMEANFRDIARSQHADYLGALERSTLELQKKFWDEVAKARREYERVIHEELRIVRQRSGQQAAKVAPAATAAEPSLELSFDYGRFAERFRGTEDYVKKNIQVYLGRFQGRGPVLDIGCGRGEFLEMMREAGVEARGIDLSEEAVARCRQKGLQVDKADLFQYLNDLPEGSLGGIFCAQVIEHLAPERLPEMIRLASAKLARDGLLALETPNPECLAIFASHFYLDPTHTRPVPHPLVAFYMEECGLGQIEVQRLSPAVESMPALAGLPADFREAFFGGLDYAIFGIKL